MPKLTSEDVKWLSSNYQGLTNKEIAAKLHVSERTISNYRAKMDLSKVSACTRNIKRGLQELVDNENTATTYIEDNITQIFRDLGEEETNVVQLGKKKEIHQFTVMLSRWNSDEGEEEGFKILAAYSRKLVRVAIQKLKIENIA